MTAEKDIAAEANLIGWALRGEDHRLGERALAVADKVRDLLAAADAMSSAADRLLVRSPQYLVRELSAACAAYRDAAGGVYARARAAEREIAAADRQLVDMIIGLGMEPMKPTHPGDPPCPEGYILIGRSFYDACRVAREALKEARDDG